VVRPEVHPLLRRAHDLMAAGNYRAAAEAYEQLAIGAQRRGIPRDAQLFLQAGRCRLLAGQVPEGMSGLKEGLTLLSQRGKPLPLQRIGERVITELQQQGLMAEADEIATFLKATIPDSFSGIESPMKFGVEKSRLLPTSCPGCGGPIRSSDVEWIDEATAECPFCGGSVRAE